jgi:hypothetical protein
LGAVSVLVIAGGVAFAAASFVTLHVLGSPFPLDLRLSIWITEGVGWTVGALLFWLAAARLGGRPMDAWAAAILAAIVISITSINAHSVPEALLVAAAIVCALAPWFAIALPPSPGRLLFVIANLALILAAPAIARVIELPFWLRTFQPIDPLRLPDWLSSRPLEWPWIVAVAPFAYGFLVGAPTECCVSAPLHSSLFVVMPAALIGLVIWFYGRRQHEKPYGWQGPAGRATRR